MANKLFGDTAQRNKASKEHALEELSPLDLGTLG